MQRPAKPYIVYSVREFDPLSLRTLNTNVMTSFIDALKAYQEKLDKMTVQEQIKFEMKEAMKCGNTELRDLLRVVMGEFSREGKELTNEQALKVIKKMHSNATELENEYEIAVLARWLPKTLTEEETEMIVEGIVNNKLAEFNMGSIMAEVKKVKGIDMRIASKVVKKLF